MSKGDPKPFRDVMKVAAHIERELTPMCERIAIVGSLRRRRALVGDIDLVILPADRLAIVQRLRKNCQIKSGDGMSAQNTVAVMATGLEINIFFARAASHDLFAPVPGNWGSLMLCRTGSRAHNIAICKRADERGLHYDPYRGLVKAEAVVAWEREDDIYAALDLPFLDPATEREDIRT